MTIKEALRRAYVAGWQDAHNGSTNDDNKHVVADTLSADIQVFDALRKLFDVAIELDLHLSKDTQVLDAVLYAQKVVRENKV